MHEEFCGFAGAGVSPGRHRPHRSSPTLPGPGHGLVANVTFSGGRGGQRPPKKVCVPKFDLQFRAKFHFFPGEKFF